MYSCNSDGGDVCDTDYFFIFQLQEAAWTLE